MANKKLGLAITGTGFISTAFAVAFKAAPKVLDLEGELGLGIELVGVSSRTQKRAEDFASRYGVANAFDDWKTMIADERVDVVAIGSEDHQHYEQGMFALEHGKHLLCEKPIAMKTEECEKLYKFAQEQKVAHAVGFTYLANPAVFLMKDLIESGELGDIHSFRGHYNEDYFSDPAMPYNWRCDATRAYCGAGADLGYHLAGLLCMLFGLPSKVAALRHTNIKERLDEATGKMREVTTDDITNAIIQYKSGISGTFQASRTATGRKLFQCLEIHGTKGAVLLDLENLNQLLVHLPHKNPQLEGYTKISIGPTHKYYKYFCPAPGHGMSFNDFVTIQAAEFLRSIVDKNAKPVADLGLGVQAQKMISAMVEASSTRKWVGVS